MVADASARLAPQGSFREQFVLYLDERLRRLEDIREYSQHPDCVFRIQRRVSRRSFNLPDGQQIRAGDPLLYLHYWNEHMPPVGPGGPALSWAKHLRWCLDLSLRELAGYLRARPQLSAIKAIRGDTVIGRPHQQKQMTRIVRHLGFAVIPESPHLSIGERFRRGGENIVARVIVGTINPSAPGGLLRRGRVFVCMSRSTLEQRYGSMRH